jgi:hypothetical protein
MRQYLRLPLLRIGSHYLGLSDATVTLALTQELQVLSGPYGTAPVPEEPELVAPSTDTPVSRELRQDIQSGLAD